MPTGPRPPIPPLHAKCEFAGRIFGHQWRNIAYLSLAGSGIGNADLNTVALAIQTAWGTRFKPSFTGDCVLDSVKLVYIPAVGDELVGIATTAQTGTAAGTATDNAGSSAILNWQVNRYYRGGHPRWYMPGLAVADVTNGSDVGSSRRTTLAAAANSFLNDVNALTSTNITNVVLGTLSFQHLGAWRVPPAFWQFFTASVNAKLGNQRRRIHG